MTAPAERPLLEMRSISKVFETSEGLLTRTRRAVDAVVDVSVEVRRGETLGLVGESGSGKTTLGRISIGLEQPTGGSVLVDGIDLAGLTVSEWRAMRGRLQIVYQDPTSALNPRMTIGAAVDEALRIHRPGAGREERRERALALLADVGLSPPDWYYARLPAGISGGQRQRVVIARALAAEPEFIVADEPLAMIDVSLRLLLLDLFKELKETHGLTYLFITHDLATAGEICDRIAIMYRGRIVEVGPARTVLREPSHAYTQALLAAVPGQRRRRGAAGAVGEAEVVGSDW